MTSVFVTGMGIVSALGVNKNSNLKSLKKAKTGIRKATYLNSSYSNSLSFGEVAKDNQSLKSILKKASIYELNRTDLLARIALEEAIADACLEDNTIQSSKTGFISSTTVGGMCSTDELYADVKNDEKPSAFFNSYDNNSHTLRIKRDYEITGYSTCINTACSSAANAIMLGSRLIKAGRLDRVIVGGVDALAKFTINGFNSLMILSDEICKPFDKNRKGLNLGEGAAYLVLEKEMLCQNKPKYAEVVGYGNSSDAFHPSSTSAEAFGPISCMQKAMKTAEILPEEIDYINTHGTGTPNNDETELYALQQLFNKVPDYSSTKSYTGHTLAASGAIEAIFSILSLQNEILFPSLNCQIPLSNETPPLREVKKKSINYIISNSFGFGGNCTSIILKKPCTSQI